MFRANRSERKGRGLPASRNEQITPLRPDSTVFPLRPIIVQRRDRRSQAASGKADAVNAVSLPREDGAVADQAGRFERLGMAPLPPRSLRSRSEQTARQHTAAGRRRSTQGIVEAPEATVLEQPDRNDAALRRSRATSWSIRSAAGDGWEPAEPTVQREAPDQVCAEPDQRPIEDRPSRLTRLHRLKGIVKSHLRSRRERDTDIES